MTVQLSKPELDILRDVLRNAPSVKKAAIFGSRALGNAKNGSDVDIVLFGSVTDDDVSHVHMTLEEETYLPYFFDVITFSTIENPALKEHIEKHGIVVYEV